MITPEMIGSYIKVFEPEANLSGEMKYSIQLIIPKSDTKGVAQLKDAIEKAKLAGKEKKWNGKIPKFRYEPLRDGDAELESGEKTEPVYKGKYFINATRTVKSKPQVVGPDAKPLLNQEELYSGCIVRADIKPYAYSSGGNHGIAWWLNSLMLVRDGQRLDGKVDAEEAFASFATTETETETVENDLV